MPKRKYKTRKISKIARKNGWVFQINDNTLAANFSKINRTFLWYLGRKLMHLRIPIYQVGLQTLSGVQYKNLPIFQNISLQQKEEFEQHSQLVDAVSSILYSPI